MKANFEKVDFLNCNNFDLNEFKSFKPNKIFSNEAINYLNSLSKEIKKNTLARDFPDIQTFAFFCRRANILRLKNLYHRNESLRLGRGIIFHIAPSNVPINFAYSLVLGLLSGNSNIVKVPSKQFEQVDLLLQAIKALSIITSHSNISRKVILVRYERSNTATATFSNFCDVRIIWGGDETIRQIRQNSLSPRSFDITFADRFSFCIINAKKLISEKNLSKIINGFYNDTFLYDQNACTSPHLIIWIGSSSEVKRGKRIFWKDLNNIVKGNYKIQPVKAVDKLTNFYSQAILQKDTTLNNSYNNLIYRVKLKELKDNIHLFKCDSGYFSEYHASSLFDISKIVNKKYQTLAYYGFKIEELKNFINETRPSGIDRIVPIGRTMDFSLTWDGYNLISNLSRVVEIE